MQATVSVPADELQKLPTALRAISTVARRTARDVLMGEAGVILKACAGETKVASPQATQLRAQKRLMADLGLTGGKRSTALDIVTINSGVKADFGRVFLRTTTGLWRRTHEANFRPVAGIASKGRRKKGDHYSDYEWLVVRSAIDAVRAQIATVRAAGKRTIGLARQSWVQIADTLGIRLEDVRGGGRLSSAGIAKARAALASNGRTYPNGLSATERTQGALIITLINRYPKGRILGMDTTLARVLHGRVRYFEENLKRGVFESAQKVARAYPYITVKAA